MLVLKTCGCCNTTANCARTAHLVLYVGKASRFARSPNPQDHLRRPLTRVNITKPCESLPTAMIGTRSGRAPARSGVARFEARFRLSPMPLTRVQRIWHLFASMDVPRRIARERVPNMGVDLIPYVDACGRPPDRSDDEQVRKSVAVPATEICILNSCNARLVDNDPGQP